MARTESQSELVIRCYDSLASFMDFSMFQWLYLAFSLVGSVLSSDPICSTSSPGRNLVDGLPPAADISESKLCLEFSAAEKCRRKVIGIRAFWKIYRINGCDCRISSDLDNQN